MSDNNIRTGLRELQAVGPEIASNILGNLAAAEQFVRFANSVMAYARHNNGQCRHCYPRLWYGEQDAADAERARAVITEAGAVVSRCCKEPMSDSLHGWCGNRDWTETNCSCECHCFVKRRIKEVQEKK